MGMIPKELNAITLADLESLRDSAVPEGKTIEYKAALPGNNDAAKKEFLGDISSFANATGGDLIYGISEEKGVPKDIIGLEVSDIDAEILRLENIVRDGLDPRIQYSILRLALEGGNIVIIFRIKQSWIGPHRIIFQGWDKFFGRNSSGKYPLDVSELRQAFNLSDSVAKKIQDFRTERIIDLAADKTPIAFIKTPKVVLHLVPFESFTTKTEVDFKKYFMGTDFRPMYAGRGWSPRLTLEGLLLYNGGSGGPSSSYVQLYRTGIIEAVVGSMIAENTIYPFYESEVIKSLTLYLKIQKELGLSTPIFAFLTLVNVKGHQLGRRAFGNDTYPIDRDILFLPEVMIENFDIDPIKALKPTFDLVWNACGWERSMNFDEQGNWLTNPQ